MDRVSLLTLWYNVVNFGQSRLSGGDSFADKMLIEVVSSIPIC